MTSHVDYILLLHQIVQHPSSLGTVRNFCLTGSLQKLKKNSKHIFVLYGAGSLLLPLTGLTTVKPVFQSWSACYSP